MADTRWEQIQAAELEFESINDVEIFASGKWNGKTFKDTDLDNIVSAYKKIGDKIKPYLKLGHDKDQKLVQKDGLPAMGWVENIRRVGSKLIADFKDVPRRIIDLIKKRAYKRVSSELYVNYEDEKMFPFVLKAVALLGGDTPAVDSLADVVALYIESDSSESEEFVIEREVLEMTEEKIVEQTEEIVEGQEQLDEVTELKAAKEALELKVAEMTENQEKYSRIVERFEKSEDLEKAVEELEEKEKAAEETKAEAEQTIENAKVKEIQEFSQGLVANNKLLPRDAELVEKLLYKAKEIDHTYEFTKDNRYGLKEEVSFDEALRKLLSNYPDMGYLQEFTSAKEMDTLKGDELRRELEAKYVKDHNVGLGIAQREVSKVRPELYGGEKN